MESKKKIRVLIVDDSILMRKIIMSGIAEDHEIEAIGSAEDPFDARDKILELEPDVITLDINMPKMNGIEFLKKLLPQYPVPVIIVSSQSGSVNVAKEIGAAAYVVKPGANGSENISDFIKELVAKIKTAAKGTGTGKNENHNPRLFKNVIAIGASTGGTEATTKVLNELSNNLPAILIVQHMPPGFTKMYAERLNSQSPMEVKEAQDNDRVLPGHVLIAAGEHHMKLERVNGELRVRSFKEEKINSHCPSVDVLFNSVAQVCKNNALGIILTGMGRDGAKGLLYMRNQGAYTIGQDEKTSVVYGMPKVAYEIGAVMEQRPLDKIPGAIYKWAEKNVW
jgi:two-component system chemotaxis response regulator CheB